MTVRMEGTTLGPYRVLSTLGSGGMGTVYLASVEGEVPGLARGTRVALKCIHGHLVDSSPENLRRFTREADVGRRIDHPNVVRTLGAGTVVLDGRTVYYLVMEFVEGRTLGEILTDTPGPAPEALCRHIGSEAARGLAAVHAAGIVHRDMKLDNVFVTNDDTVKIMDFGLAFVHGEMVRISRSGMFLGSLAYAAPEQIDGEGGAVDHRSDLYALGWILYALAAGGHPLKGMDYRAVVGRQLRGEPEPLRSINPRISPFLEAVVHRLLAKDPENRFGSADGVAEVLQEGESSPWWRERCRGGDRPAPGGSPLLGRREELRVLGEALREAATGSGAVVLVHGEAGAGKSRLLEEFRAEVEREGGKATFLTLSFPLPGERPGLPPGMADPAAPLSALVEAAARGSRRPGEPPPAGPDLLRRLADSLSREGTTVLVLENVHAGGAPAEALFASLSAEVRGRRILLVRISRTPPPPGPAAEGGGPPGPRGRHLRGRGREDLAALLSAALGSGSPDSGLLDRVLGKSGGNPLFALEILRRFREGGDLVERADGAWCLKEGASALETIMTVGDLLGPRIGELPPADREILEAAACAGYEFDPLVVGDALGHAPIPLLRRLNALQEKQGLVRAAGDRFVFQSRPLQESILRGLPKAAVRLYGAALEASGKGRRSPAAAAGGFAARARAADPGEAGPGKARVVIVDDTDATRNLLGEQVLALGHEAVLASDGITGLARIRRVLPDLVLLDLEMPGLDGREVLARLKQGDRTRDIPVIIVTGLAENAVAVHCLDAGADDFLVKPFDLAVLRARIRPCIERRMRRIRDREFERRLEEANLRLVDEVRARTGELEAAHARLSEVDGAKDGFLALIAHEMRTPLTGLVASSDIIIGEAAADDGLGELREIFRGSLKRLNRLVDDALLLTELRLAADDHPREERSLAGILRGAAADAAPFAAARGVALDVPSLEGVVAATGSLLDRALSALLECAVKFCEPGQAVSVTGGPAGSGILLQIRTPSGTLPPSAQAGFFEVFGVADPVTPGGDLGLGPAVAEKVVRLQGGSVEVQSLDPGGILFTVTLPAATPAGEWSHE